MPTMKNRSYGSPMGTEDPIDDGRPSAGDADDATRSKAIKAKLAEKESPSSAPPAASGTTSRHTDTDINTFSPIDNIRKGNKRIDDAIEDDSK